MAATLGRYVRFKIGDPNADFWLIRSHTREGVGRPTKTYNKDAIGVTVTATDVLVPNYLYYYMLHAYNSGLFRQLAAGTTIQHITIRDLKRIPVRFR